jgi:hypothetical protein
MVVAAAVRARFWRRERRVKGVRRNECGDGLFMAREFPFDEQFRSVIQVEEDFILPGYLL